MTTTERVIVCGGRLYGRAASQWGLEPEEIERLRVVDKREQDFLAETLAGYGLRELAEGGAPGADYWAARWARRNSVLSRTYPADWTRNGRRAGVIRNQFMLSDFRPDAVIAFPGGLGTADMIRRAKAASVTVIEVTP